MLPSIAYRLTTTYRVLLVLHLLKKDCEEALKILPRDLTQASKGRRIISWSRREEIPLQRAYASGKMVDPTPHGPLKSMGLPLLLSTLPLPP